MSIQPTTPLMSICEIAENYPKWHANQQSFHWRVGPLQAHKQLKIAINGMSEVYVYSWNSINWWIKVVTCNDAWKWVRAHLITQSLYSIWRVAIIWVMKMVCDISEASSKSHHMKVMALNSYWWFILLWRFFIWVAIHSHLINAIIA